MNITVCMKIANGEPNPFDEAALECALQIGGDITVLSMGPPLALPVLQRMTRLGVKAILISDPVFAGSDTLATAYILSLAVKKLKPDLILCGRQSIDGDTAQVGPCLATMLNMPVITNIMQQPELAKTVKCQTRMGEENSDLPCLLTIERIHTLRFPSIGKRAGEVEIWDNSVLNADVSRCGLSGSPTKVMKVFENKKGQRRCKFIQRDELMPLIEKLKNEEAKAQAEKKTPDKKLREVWTIGEIKEAEAIAEKIVVIDERDPHKIAELAKEKQPEVILWNADLWGRKNAPITAALLQTGLCADCTALETDGKRLFMYRPARSGSVTAKIECRTNPQMATVRTETQSGEIVVAAGKGVKDDLERLMKFAESVGADFGASRGLVDLGAAPYSAQIGLTGKSVSPKIYIAVGISGAVHHTCAIENAGTIIAINPDKNARIFEYADYGIVWRFYNSDRKSSR